MPVLRGMCVGMVECVCVARLSLRTPTFFIFVKASP